MLKNIYSFRVYLKILISTFMQKLLKRNWAKLGYGINLNTF